MKFFLKKAAFTLSILGAAILTTSCEKDLDKRLDGEWNFKWDAKANASTTDIELFADYDTVITGIANFNDDGTGTLTPNGDTEEDDIAQINWVNKDNDVLIMTILNQPSSPNEIYVYNFNIIENKKKSQQWEATESLNDTLDGIPFTFTINVKMELTK